MKGLGGGPKTELAPGRGKPQVRHCSRLPRFAKQAIMNLSDVSGRIFCLQH